MLKMGVNLRFQGWKAHSVVECDRDMLMRLFLLFLALIVIYCGAFAAGLVVPQGGISPGEVQPGEVKAAES